MRPLFQSPELQRNFERDGFARFKLLDSLQAEKLLAIYQQDAKEHEQLGIKYITTSHTNNHELIRKVDNEIRKILSPGLAKYMCNYKLLFGNFLVKLPGEGSETPPHQDITFVDEQLYTSVNIWVALQDTDERNGCMRFLKGSHKFMPTLRPTHDYPWAYDNVGEVIEKYLVSYPAKAGDAFVFDHSVVHASFANSTSVPRIAAVIAAYTDDAELLHYFLPKGETTTVQKYLMDKEAFLHFIKEQPPAKGKFVGTLDFDFRQVNEQEFEKMLPKAKGLFSRIFG